MCGTILAFNCLIRREILDMSGGWCIGVGCVLGVLGWVVVVLWALVVSGNSMFQADTASMSLDCETILPYIKNQTSGILCVVVTKLNLYKKH